MASPISLKGLDEVVETGAKLFFIGVGEPGMRCDYWIVVALPFNEDRALVLVSSNNPTIRTLRHADSAQSLIERYPDKGHIQTAVLPLIASLKSPEDIYQLGRGEIEEFDPNKNFVPKSNSNEN